MWYKPTLIPSNTYQMWYQLTLILPNICKEWYGLTLILSNTYAWCDKGWLWYYPTLMRRDTNWLWYYPMPIRSDTSWKNLYKTREKIVTFSIVRWTGKVFSLTEAQLLLYNTTAIKGDKVFINQWYVKIMDTRHHALSPCILLRVLQILISAPEGGPFERATFRYLALRASTWWRYIMLNLSVWPTKLTIYLEISRSWLIIMANNQNCYKNIFNFYQYLLYARYTTAVSLSLKVINIYI